MALVRMSQVSKAVDRESMLFDVSPQNGVGIPRTRMNPISPLAMYASGSIMADAFANATGRRLSRRQRNYVAAQGQRLSGGAGMLFSPLGRGARMTG